VTWRCIVCLPAFRWLWVLGAAVALSTGVWGCQLVGRGGPTSPGISGPEAEPLPPPQGTYSGFMEIEGGRVNGTLTLIPSGGEEFDGFFESPPDLLARGQGRMRGLEFRLDLSYEGSCPGRMRLTGRVEAGSGDLTGAVRASDCTGAADGTFLFQPG
jgi:hypothetical protein